MKIKIFLLTLLIIIFSSLIYYQSLYNLKSVTQIPNSTVKIELQPISPQVDILGWSTYTNNQNQLSFRHPKDWEVVGDTGNSFRIWPPDVSNKMKDFMGGGGGSFLTNSVNIYESADAIQAIKFIRDNSDKYIVTKDILLDGELATIYYSIFKVEPYGAGLGDYFVDVVQKRIIGGVEKIFVFTVMDPTYLKTYMAILSTLEFANQ